MTRPRGVLIALALALAAWPGLVGEAHKPILSPYTFAEHAGPIFKARCGGCHRPGGAGPMSLLTHEDAMPWAESIRLELIAGHMPPWDQASPPGRFHGSSLTASELNTLLVWAAGGTPQGTATATDGAPAPLAWRMGTPDLSLTPVSPFAMGADIQDQTVEFTLPTDLGRDRLLRAVDVLPSSPSIVRSAVVRLASPSGDAEPLLALWLPGDEAVPVSDKAGFLLPAGASLVVAVHYRKSWKQEREAMTDAPSIGLYFADGADRTISAVPLRAPAHAAGAVTFSHTLDRDLAIVAVYPDPAMQGMVATVRVTRPDSPPELLVAVRPRHGWARRYWLREPMRLARGTRLDVSLDPDNEQALLPPGLSPDPGPPTAGGVTLNGYPF
jgi:hypothetical protein